MSCMPPDRSSCAPDDAHNMVVNAERVMDEIASLSQYQGWSARDVRQLAREVLRLEDDNARLRRLLAEKGIEA